MIWMSVATDCRKIRRPRAATAFPRLLAAPFDGGQAF